MDLILVRLLFVIFVAVTCYLIRPFGLPPRLDAGVGAVLGLVIVIFEWRLRLVSLKRLIGAAIGSADDALLLRVNRALALFLSIV